MPRGEYQHGAAQVVGRGNCKKDDVMAWCRQQGWNPSDTDASDAAAVWAYAVKVWTKMRIAA